MLTRTQKDLFYRFCGPLMRANGWIYRIARAPRKGPVNVQLGPGQRNYIPGWINIDANILTAKCDAWVDLRNPLPFHDSSIDVFYSHHVIEHLPNLRAHFKEMFRCLKPGGIFRVGGPNGDSAIRKFSEGELNWFSTFPDQRQTLGGRFENFIFCRGEHLTILTRSWLEELASEAGFKNFQVCLPVTQTFHPHLIDSAVLSKEHEDCPECPHTLIIEGEKPRDSTPDAQNKIPHNDKTTKRIE